MRLTKKFGKYDRPYCFNCKESIDYSIKGNFIVDRALNKLGQLEDIEEELGIDLITLFKILKRKHIYCVQKYYKEIQQMIMYGECDLTGIFVYEEGFEYPECSHHLSYKDYGKTWALTKEELTDR